ncbi:MAG: PhoH family protein [Spirochaetes bacterium]|nr:PhoH family protein [Spirochaetota bacterium]
MLKNKNGKIFVIDTNVILYDHRCIYSFEEHDIVIPITVIEEMDRFKRGNEIINYNARQFAREMDALSEDKLFSEGVKLKTGGIIIVDTNINKDDYLNKVFWEDKPDHRIISVAYNLQKEHGKGKVVFVSKDMNLRMKAKSIGVHSEDYETGKVPNIDELYKGRKSIEDIPSNIIDEIYEQKLIDVNKIKLISEPMPNEFFILRSNKKSALVAYNTEEKTIRRVEKKKAYGIDPRNAEQTFALDALMNDKILLVTLSGKAGTGKTLLTLAAALEVQKNYKQIFLARPIIPLSNRDLGYLPGDIKSKMNPFMQPLFDNLSVIKHQYEENSVEYKSITKMLDNEQLLITPLAYIRGRSLAKVYFIVDEAQNLTPHEVKTIITRAGEGTKIVLTGDPYQIDTPYLDSRSNGLTYLIDKMKGQNIYAHITLEKGERSYLSELASNLL